MKKEFKYFQEQFADIKILRFKVPGFESLSLQQKKLIYYLSQAANAGREIIFDQNGMYNRLVRGVLEAIYTARIGVEQGEAIAALEVYLKRVWFSNGIHHHYSTDKLIPGFTKEDLARWMNSGVIDNTCYDSTFGDGDLFKLLEQILFDPDFMSKRVCQSQGKDLIVESANNFYSGISQKEVEDFYALKKEGGDSILPSFGLNSRLVKEEGEIKEEVWKVGGKYSEEISTIVLWLEKAVGVACNAQQKNVIELLINYYNTGDLKVFDTYSIEWVKDLQSSIDFINGFIENYGDPLGIKATWEALVNFTDDAETAKAKLIAENATWFEKHSPVNEVYKKETVSGVSMKVINAVMLGGDCYPVSPLGINLPNSDWIRELHGSKSVSLANISHAYHQASLGNGFIEEFAFDEDEVRLHVAYGALADDLHTHLHECVGHGSGKSLPGITMEMLKAYGSVIEETRADLFGLYFINDQKLIDLGLMPNFDVAKTQYNAYIRNGLMTQLTRIEAGKDIEQAHMRNRQTICKWVFEKGNADKVIERKVRDGKMFFVINDYKRLHELFGELLIEVQRIKSEGDYEAARSLIETYGITVESNIHKEVLERFKKLGIAPYSGFLNPKLTPIYASNDLVDVTISYDESFSEQMLRYGKEW